MSNQVPRSVRTGLTWSCALTTITLHAATIPTPEALSEQRRFVNQNLESMQLQLSTRPTEFHLSYSGAPLEFHGLLCYSFGGYNETCIDPKVEWLTPATVIRLPAPGGVPSEFLRGYVALVRYPELSDVVFRYPAENDGDGHR